MVTSCERYQPDIATKKTPKGNEGFLVLNPCHRAKPKNFTLYLLIFLFICQYNKLTHACSSFSVFGVMSDQDLLVLNSTEHYAKRTSTDPEAEGTKVAHFTWDDIEHQTGLTINTLVIDCEGCLFPLIEMYKHKFRLIKKIIVENDENYEEGLFDLLFFNGCGEKWALHSLSVSQSKYISCF
jgi:hypothetical protein